MNPVPILGKPAAQNQLRLCSYLPGGRSPQVWTGPEQDGPQQAPSIPSGCCPASPSPSRSTPERLHQASALSPSGRTPEKLHQASALSPSGRTPEKLHQASPALSPSRRTPVLPGPQAEPPAPGGLSGSRLPSQLSSHLGASRFLIKADPGRVSLPLLPSAARTQRVPLTRLLGHAHGDLSLFEVRTTVSRLSKTSARSNTGHI